MNSLKTIFVSAIFVAAFLLFSNVTANPGARIKEQREVALDLFLQEAVKDFQKSNVGTFILANDTSFTASQALFNVSGKTFGMQARNLSDFAVLANSNVATQTVSIRLDFPSIFINGNYTMDGVYNSIIILRGDGPFNQTASFPSWMLSFTIAIDFQRYASLVNFNFESGFSNVTSEFKGIEGEELIGELIKDSLQAIGQEAYRKIETSSMLYQFGETLRTYVNIVLQTKTIDEILYGDLTTTASSSTLTSTVVTSSVSPTTTGPIMNKTLDVLGELPNSGWIVPSNSDCGYSSSLIGFFCSGELVDISEPFDGVGFWMSPCIGGCTLSYSNTRNENILKLGIRVYYNDWNLATRMGVYFFHDGGTREEYLYERSNGNYVEVDFTKFSNITGITVYFENNGSGWFTVMDSLTLTIG